MSGAPSIRSKDALSLFFARGIRGFVDGAVSVLLAGYLLHLGFDAFDVGTLVTATLLGSAALTLATGLLGHRYRRRRILIFAAALMLATGVGFHSATSFWALLAIGIVGTLNPSAGDVTMFLPAEQAALSEAVSAGELTHAFAWYNVAGGIAGALGSLASSVPVVLAMRVFHSTEVEGERAWFAIYAAAALAAGLAYLCLSNIIEGAPKEKLRAPLERSRSIVIRLSLLFSLDAFGGGFVVQSMLVLWLHKRFDLSTEALGTIFFASNLLGALSQLVSSRLADRFGRINTMVFTHLPANALLIVAALMPTAPLAITFLLLRAAMSSMDVPARQSYVMAVVPPEERAAASSVTNVPRSLAAAISPLFAGAMLEHSSTGWPLVFAGALKALYDLLLLALFRGADRKIT
jgi:MFS family permease